MLHTACSTKFNLLCWPLNALYHTCVTCVFRWPPLLRSCLWLVNSYPILKSHLQCHQSFVMSFLDIPPFTTAIIIHSLLLCSHILNIPPVQWLSYWIVRVSLQSRSIYKIRLFVRQYTWRQACIPAPEKRRVLYNVHCVLEQTCILEQTWVCMCVQV